MKKILIIDDEVDFIDVLAELLGHEEYEVTSESNFEKSKQLIESNTYDLILSDIRMEGMNGLDLIPVAKKSQANTPFVMFSGSIEYNYESVVAKGARDFFKKPMDIPVLMDRIKKILT